MRRVIECSIAARRGFLRRERRQAQVQFRCSHSDGGGMLMSVSQATPVIATPDISTKQYTVIGTRPIRPDGVDKVTGRAQYGADIRLTGMLFGRIKRSPHAHARIKSIDVSRALALPGVKAVVTSADLPSAADRIQDLGEGAANLRDLSNNVLAGAKVLYTGHAVAAVAATSPHIAQEALGLIDVEYELLPPVLDVRDAMRSDAPILDENRRTKSLGGTGD